MIVFSPAVTAVRERMKIPPATWRSRGLAATVGSIVLGGMFTAGVVIPGAVMAVIWFVVKDNLLALAVATLLLALATSLWLALYVRCLTSHARQGVLVIDHLVFSMGLVFSIGFQVWAAFVAISEYMA